MLKGKNKEQEQMGSYLNIVECKLIVSKTPLNVPLGSYLNIVECKFDYSSGGVFSWIVVI